MLLGRVGKAKRLQVLVRALGHARGLRGLEQHMEQILHDMTKHL